MKNKKLTKIQKKFIESITLKHDDKSPDDWLECDRKEWHTAVSLVKRGLVETDPPIDYKLTDHDYDKCFLARRTINDEEKNIEKILTLK